MIHKNFMKREYNRKKLHNNPLLFLSNMSDKYIYSNN